MANFSEKKMQEIRDRTISKVLWGEHKDLTIEFLRKQGLGGPEIGEILDEAYAEKARILRRRLIANMAIYFVGAIVFGMMMFFLKSRPMMLQNPAGKALFIITIVACAGCMSLLLLSALDAVRKEKSKAAVLKE